MMCNSCCRKEVVVVKTVFVCLNSRVGVCGICSPGQHPVPVVVGDLLVSVLPSLLLLLRPLLLLSRHLLLSTTPSVITPSAPCAACQQSHYMRGSLFSLSLSV